MRHLIFGLVLVHAFTQSHAAVIYVPDDCPTIQDAIDNASSGDTIIVKAGTYFETIDFIGKAIHLKSDSGSDCTTIDGSQAGSVVTFQNGESTDSLIEGFTIRNGSGTLKPSDNDYFGGGIRCDLSSPVIMDNIIENNSVMGGNGGGSGGGIYCWASSATIIGNTIRGNWAFSGGAVGCASGSPTVLENIMKDNNSFYGGAITVALNSAVIEKNIIIDNTANYCGGGIRCCNYGSARIVENWISNNWSQSGGGIYCEYYCSPLIVNNLIAENMGEWDGGALAFNTSAEPTVTNNTIVRNETYGLYGRGGGGIYVSCSSIATVKNTILFGNVSPSGPEIYLDNHNGASKVDIEYCDVEGGQSLVYVESGCTLNWGPGMIDADPLFADSTSDDFHLTWDSPCRDTGDNSAVNETVDFEGDPRIALSAVDMGADEFYYHIYQIGDVVPGGNINIKIVGYPTAPVKLAWGQTILDPPYPTQHGDLCIWPFHWYGFVGTVPSNGILTIPVTVSLSWSTGDSAPMQALVGPWGWTYSRLTNLNVVTVE